jgi:putative flippase GtrA
MRRGARIASLYLLFAVIATAANLLAQMAVVRVVPGAWSIPLSILIGTLVGLPVKYVLDKKWIFAHVTVHVRDNVRLFALYTGTAVATTLIFWGAEGLFQMVFGTERMRLVGGTIGLAIGYFAKYLLDRRFVFNSGTQADE